MRKGPVYLDSVPRKISLTEILSSLFYTKICENSQIGNLRVLLNARPLSLSINYLQHVHPKWATFSTWLKGRKCHDLDMSTARRRLKSPWSLSWTSAHPTMVTQVNTCIKVMNGWLTSLSLQVNRLSHSWDKAISDSDLETPRSRSWVWSKGKVIESAQYPINSLLFHFTSTRPTIPEIQLFWNLTLKHPRSRSWVRSKVKVTYHTQYPTFHFTSIGPIIPELWTAKCLTLKKKHVRNF